MIIGIAGLAGQGKSTAARITAELLGYTEYAFADPIKTFFKEAFLWDTEHLYGHLKEQHVTTPFISGRDLAVGLKAANVGCCHLQAIINFRNTFERFCIQAGLLDSDYVAQYKVSPRVAMQLFGTEVCRSLDEAVWVNAALERAKVANLVIGDVRFENEVNAIKSSGGILIHIDRDQAYNVNQHSSEAFDTKEVSNYCISNTGTIKDLRDSLKAIYNKEKLI